MFPAEFVTSLKADDYPSAIAFAVDELMSDPDNAAWYRGLGIALDEVDRRWMPTASLLSLIGIPEVRTTPEAALVAYTRAWLRSGKTDDISRRRMDSLRKVLGYHYEDWCWACHEYLSDAPGDNGGNHWHRSFDCYVCKACRATRCTGWPRG